MVSLRKDSGRLVLALPRVIARRHFTQITNRLLREVSDGDHVLFDLRTCSEVDGIAASEALSFAIELAEHLSKRGAGVSVRLPANEHLVRPLHGAIELLQPTLRVAVLKDDKV